MMGRFRLNRETTRDSDNNIMAVVRMGLDSKREEFLGRRNEVRNFTGRDE
jgi:hypothetical protein